MLPRTVAIYLTTCRTLVPKLQHPSFFRPLSAQWGMRIIVRQDAPPYQNLYHPAGLSRSDTKVRAQQQALKSKDLKLTGVQIWGSRRLRGGLALRILHVEFSQKL